MPLVAGDATPEEVAEVLDALWGGDETLVVVSSDLSHYDDYDAARRLDAATARAIEALRPEAHRRGRRLRARADPRAAARRAGAAGCGVRTLDLRSSGDTAGPRDRVVGYGAFAVG